VRVIVSGDNLLDVTDEVKCLTVSNTADVLTLSNYTGRSQLRIGAQIHVVNDLPIKWSIPVEKYIAKAVEINGPVITVTGVGTAMFEGVLKFVLVIDDVAYLHDCEPTQASKLRADIIRTNPILEEIIDGKSILDVVTWLY